MLVKNVLRILNDLPLDAEICIQWYEKEDMEAPDEQISDDVWDRANCIINNWETTDLRYQLDDAILLAKKELGLKTEVTNETV
ncbi:hypothetical protein uvFWCGRAMDCOMC440_024 [Freshwater phage uvFW-CGR-AMD-COM-C440]|jgi:phage terminase Nu1 subunit (DNA packaging protein)|nr:hypothetical protein uvFWCGRAMDCOMC440_024 [Freshwater phage uvFW-CGR-AMD-COM-C440]